MAEHRTAVAVVGVGAIFPGAADAGRFWENIAAGVDAIGEVPAGRWDPEVYFRPDSTDRSAVDHFYCRRGGFIDDLADFDPLAFGFMPSAIHGTEPDQLLALRTAAEAIADAGGETVLPDRRRIGVILGRGGYLTPAMARLDSRVRTGHQITEILRELVPGMTEEQLGAVRTAFSGKLGPAGQDASIGIVPNLAASRVANRFDFRGPAYTVDGACASALLAVDHAVRELQSGRCDAVLAGAVHHCHLATLWSVFTQLRALSPTQTIRPFDRRADGTLMSEGTGVMLLKRLEDASKDGDRIYAVIRGVGVASDGRSSSLMSPLTAGQVQAVEDAWAEAGLDPASEGSLGLLEAHGTATPAGDLAELATLARVFGPPQGAPVPLGTVKSMIGHAMPAAGIAGLIKAALAVFHGVKPVTLHVDEPHEELGNTRFTPATTTEPWEPDAAGGPRRAAVNAFGFGGINAHVILEQAPASAGSHAPVLVATAPPPPGPRMLLLAGADAEDISRQLAAPDADLLAGAGRVPIDAGPVRLAVVDPSERSLELARRIAARGTPWRGRSDVWFTPEPLLRQGGSVALLFPGFEPDFEARVDDVARHFGLAAPELRGRSNLVDRSLDIIAVGRLLNTALERVGITPDLLAGHSIGEWTAMLAAGMHDEAMVDRLIAQLNPDKLEMPQVDYAALGCGAARAAEAIDGLKGVTISHDNCPHQSIICGIPGAVARAVGRLRDEGVMGQTLSFQSGFHTPLLADYVGPFRAETARLAITPARVPIWSATTLDEYPRDPDSIRELVIRHLLEPVRFGPLLNRLWDHGVRAFVQMGVGSLTGFVDDTLKHRPHLAISASAAGREGMPQLARVAAALWTEGREPDLQVFLPAQTQAPARRESAGSAAPRPTRLDLGTPLIRLEGTLPPVSTGAGRPMPPAGSDPLFTDLQAALQEADDAALSVLKAWDISPRRPVATPSPSGARINVSRTLSLATLPYVRDHCLIPMPAGWPDDSDRFPVVALTSLLEIMAEHARELAPGRHVVGFSQVRAMKWLVVDPPTVVDIRAEQLSADQVKVVIEGYSSGIVRLASAWPVDQDTADEPLTGLRPPVVGADRLYADGWMFHGPQFAGVAEITAMADNGLIGKLDCLQAPGSLLDNAGQLIGHWMQVGVEKDKMVFPTAVERVDLFGPLPPAGTLLDCTVWIRSVTPSSMRADCVLRFPDGTAWGRITGWSTRRFATDDLTWTLKSKPQVTAIGELQPGGWCLAPEHCPDFASRELMMRRYLCAAEREQYRQKTPRRQAQWLLGRIAAKDAVRHLLWSEGVPSVYPAEIQIDNDPQGRPLVSGPGTEGVFVSISHTGECAVGIASRSGPLGIDICRVEPRSDYFDDTALTPAEQSLAASSDDRAAAQARLWAAKEAAAKAAGTGLQGRPRSFEVNETGTGSWTVSTPDGAQTPVSTVVVADSGAEYAVAWTSPRPVRAGTSGGTG